MSQALYRKWRPLQWDQVVGQDHIIQTLQNAVSANRVAHAYLFAGPRGTGKTTTARLLAKAVNCLEADLSVRPCNQCEHCQAVTLGRFLDMIEIDAASNTSVEDVRDLRDKINFSPNQGRFKVYIIDEVHMLSPAAFNALLKTLEEPPPHAIFILATTEVHKLPATVISRCQRHEFRRISVKEIVTYLREMANEEGIHIEPEALTFIARQATGAMRDAISLLDQLGSAGKSVTLEMAQAVLGTAASQAVLEVIEGIIDQKPAAGLAVIHRSLDAGSDPRQFARQIVEYLRGLMLIRMGNADQIDATSDLRAQMARHAQLLSAERLLQLINAFNRAAVESRASWQPSLPLEVALIESTIASDSVEEENTPPTDKGKKKSQDSKSGGSFPPLTGKDVLESRQVNAQVDEQREAISPADPQEAQRLGENWKQILAQVRQRNPNTYALLNSCRTRHLRGNVLILGFASELLKSKMERSDNVEIVRRVLEQVIGQEIMIRCQTTAGKQNTPPPEVDNDGMVAAALRDLGGEIVDIQ
jgi:DNA polymerase III subunit gamma/tau